MDYYRKNRFKLYENFHSSHLVPAGIYGVNNTWTLNLCPVTQYRRLIHNYHMYSLSDFRSKVHIMAHTLPLDHQISFTTPSMKHEA